MKDESPQERRALEELDEATRDVASAELEKERERERSGFFGPLTLSGLRFRARPMRWRRGDPVPEPVDDPDPGGERGLRDALHEDGAKE